MIRARTSRVVLGLVTCACGSPLSLAPPNVEPCTETTRRLATSDRFLFSTLPQDLRPGPSTGISGAFTRGGAPERLEYEVDPRGSLEWGVLEGGVVVAQGVWPDTRVLAVEDVNADGLLELVLAAREKHTESTWTAELVSLREGERRVLHDFGRVRREACGTSAAVSDLGVRAYVSDGLRMRVDRYVGFCDELFESRE